MKKIKHRIWVLASILFSPGSITLGHPDLADGIRTTILFRRRTMLQIMPESEGKIIGIRIAGKLTD
ncbi:MAG: hypothetical protein KJ822_17105, partial [Proteobacteria bacterium]|nr:hypothetical protein [Pseudomonadota bacterium]